MKPKRTKAQINKFVQAVTDSMSPNCQVCGQVMKPNKQKETWECRKCKEIRKSLLAILGDYDIGVFESDNQGQQKEIAEETVEEIMCLLGEHFGPDYFFRLRMGKKEYPVKRVIRGKELDEMLEKQFLEARDAAQLLRRRKP